MDTITLKATYVLLINGYFLDNVENDKIEYLIKHLIYSLELPIVIYNYNIKIHNEVFNNVVNYDITYSKYKKLKYDIYDVITKINNNNLFLYNIMYNPKTKKLKIVLKG